ncbi:MAG: riboflavin synthase [Pseudomonadota bacterium]|nr:riboflavin synthase [Pseudomonadota bacterium]
MFSGIIDNIGVIESAERGGDLRLVISCACAKDLAIGESVACNGVCLTVVEKNASSFTAELSTETLSRTTPGWNVGDKVNLERSLRLGDRLSGHLVTGHVDGVAVLKDITPQGDSHILCLEAPQSLARFIAEKGSVALDGVSLTVNRIEENQFSVNIIAHTWQATTLGQRRPGDALNLEIDLIARYAARLMGKQDI